MPGSRESIIETLGTAKEHAKDLVSQLADSRWPVSRANGIADVFRRLHLLNHDQATARMLASRYNPLSLSVRNGKEDNQFPAILKRDPDARMYGLDFTFRGPGNYRTPGFVSSDVAGAIERTDNFDFTVAVPYRLHRFDRSVMKDVEVQLPETVVDVASTSDLYRAAAAKAIVTVLHES